MWALPTRKKWGFIESQVEKKKKKDSHDILADALSE
jgi:hypothetical protein